MTDRRVSALLITVNYKGTSSTIDLLASIHRAEDSCRVDVLIVDNGSQAEERSKLQEAVARYPNVKLVNSDKNRGYFGAAKFGLDHYLEQGHVLPNWTIVCNHDLVLSDVKFFTKLFYSDQSVGVIAPRIQVIADGADQNPFMRSRPGRLRWASLRFIYSNYPCAFSWDWLSRQKRKLLRLWKEVRQQPKRDSNLHREDIYAPHGSFFIFSQRFFSEGGYLDENLFLYGEEICVAEICRSLGLRISYDPALSVLHHEHLSTGRGITRFSYNCQKQALLYLSDSGLRLKSLSISQAGQAS